MGNISIGKIKASNVEVMSKNMMLQISSMSNAMTVPLGKATIAFEKFGKVFEGIQDEILINMMIQPSWKEATEALERLEQLADECV